MTMPKAEDRFERSRMRLGVWKAIGETLSFCLRHVVAFYLLGLLISLPGYFYSLLSRGELFGVTGSRPWWEELVALTAVEALLAGFVIAAMTRTLLHDRRGEDWTVFVSLREALSRLPTVCGTALVFAVVVYGGFAVAGLLGWFSQWVAIAAMVFVVYLAVIISVAVPVAALDEGDAVGGISYSLERSGDLTKGSRWRVLAVFFLPMLPFIVVAVAAVFAIGGDIAVEDIDPLWALLGGAILNAFFFALPVVIHEALVALKEGPGVGDKAKVFD